MAEVVGEQEEEDEAQEEGTLIGLVLPREAIPPIYSVQYDSTAASRPKRKKGGAAASRNLRKRSPDASRTSAVRVDILRLNESSVLCRRFSLSFVVAFLRDD